MNRAEEVKLRLPRAALALLCIGLLAGCAGSEAKREAIALGVEPSSSPADLYVEMASAYYQRGQIDAALERGLRAVQADKRNSDAHYVLAIIFRRLNKEAEAEEHFAEALRLDPNNPDYLNAQGTALCTRGRYAEAIELFDKAVANQLYRAPEVALMNASDCSRRANRLTEAERLLREALTRNPSYPPALLAMATLSFERGDAQAARDYITRYGRVGAPTPTALLTAYRIERKLGNKDSAKALADALRARYPDAPQVMEL
jgi:type IV pilus assembly protein PilF